jgi:hypothetical protein
MPRWGGQARINRMVGWDRDIDLGPHTQTDRPPFAAESGNRKPFKREPPVVMQPVHEDTPSAHGTGLQTWGPPDGRQRGEGK